LHSSIDTILDGVCVIYLLFYTSSPIILEKYVRTKLEAYHTGRNIVDIACVIANLRVTKPDPLAYLIHYYYVNTEDFPPTHVAFIEPPTDVPHPLVPLWRALHMKSPRNIGYYLNISVQKAGYTAVKEFLVSNSKWQFPSYVPMFVGEDSCSLAALCARFIRGVPISRREVIQPVPKARVAEINRLYEPRGEALITRLNRTRAHPVYSPLLPGQYDRLDLNSDDLTGHVAESWYVWASESRLWRARNAARPLKKNFYLNKEELLGLKNPIGSSALALYASPEEFCHAALDSWLASCSASLKIG
tara:strand:+ start:1720 stop:2628 length:909 start_codon:yes stop_codon:yes gene_type:complete